jgi:hypothetical protein
MSIKKKIHIRRSERALLTDTLPYELPIYFHNTNLAVLAALADAGPHQHEFHARYLLTRPGELKATRPILYDVSKDAEHNRRLALAHPRSQHAMSLFYRDFKHFILNACARPSYSLRYPSRVATHYLDPRYTTRVDALDTDLTDEDPVGFRTQSRWASTFFSYRPYSLSHRFFESEEFLSLEQTHSHLLKIDVARCFDSIYTHSIEWTMRGKDFAKRHLPKKNRPSNFEAAFDEVIRSANWNETHGIIVGPEFSRIFAEIILQSVDRSIASRLRKAEIDVEVRRYVDDYFIFSNSRETLAQVQSVISVRLRELNLHLNEEKTSITERPFVSTGQVVKQRVAQVIEHFFVASREALELSNSAPDASRLDKLLSSTFRLMRNIATQFGVGYNSFSSHALTVIQRQTAFSRIRLQSGPVESQTISARLAWIIGITRLSQLLYSTNPRAVTSIKIAAVFNSIKSLAEAMHCALAPFHGQLVDGLRAAHPKDTVAVIDEIARINQLCAVDRLIGKNTDLTEDDIFHHLAIDPLEGALSDVSVFQLLTMLLIARRRHRFAALRELATSEIIRRLTAPRVKVTEETEAAILLTEFIACPHIDTADKYPVIQLCYERVMQQVCSLEKAALIVTHSSWISFVDWSSSVQLGTMLARKELTLAYEQA